MYEARPLANLEADSMRESLALKFRWHVVRQAAGRRGDVLLLLLCLVLACGLVGLYGAVYSYMAYGHRQGEMVEVWRLLSRLVGGSLILACGAGEAHMMWFVGHHLRGLQAARRRHEQTAVGTWREGAVEDNEWAMLRRSSQGYILAYGILIACGVVAWAL